MSSESGGTGVVLESASRANVLNLKNKIKHL